MCVFNFLKCTFRRKNWRYLNNSKSTYLWQIWKRFCLIQGNARQENICLRRCNLGNCLSGKCLLRELFIPGTAHWGNVFGELSIKKMSSRNFLSGKCLWRKVRQETVLEPIALTKDLLRDRIKHEHLFYCSDLVIK